VSDAERAALQDIRGYASANRIGYAPHALARMLQRNVRRVDVHHALVAARVCASQPGARYKVTGPDFDGDDLDVIVVIEDGVLVVTLF
jgi:hypothetical protein